MTADLRSRSLAYLRDGAVEVQQVDDQGSPLVEGSIRTVMATVEGHRAKYIIDGRIGLDDDHQVLWEQWSCTCRNYTADACAHRAAVQLVTGGRTEIRPQPKARSAASVA